MTTSSLARADAAFHEQVHRQWRDWHTFLTSQRTLLDARTDMVRVAFERAESREIEVADAERQLAALPPAQRALFAQICEERRQQVTAAAERTPNERVVDPDANERVTLSALLAEADGTAEGADRTPGWGDVPLQIDGSVQWYRVHVAALRDAPAAAYAAGTDDPDGLRRRFVLAGLLGVGTVIFLSIWFLWPRGRAQHADGVARRPTGNGVASAAWPIHGITLTTQQGDTPLTINPITTEMWATAAPSTGQWQTGTFAPVQLCVPRALLEDAATLHLHGAGAFPERTYHLTRTMPNRADVQLAACDGPIKTLFGTLEQTARPATQELGAAVRIDAATTITVTSITITSAAQNPLLPADRAEVTVTISGAALDWPTYAPTLTLADGTAMQTPEQQAGEHGVALRYTIPLPESVTAAQWSITAPTTGMQYRWRATLAPPPTRATVLAGALRIRAVTPQRDPSTRQLMLQLELGNQGRTPLQLTPADIVITQDAQLLPTPDLAALRSPLAVGETRTVALPIPDHPATALDVTVGRARYAIVFP